MFFFFYMNEKEKKVNTGRRHRHILGSQASRQEMPRGLAPCSLRFFFFFEMKIKCGYFLVVERTTLENLSSTSRVISRNGGYGCLLLNRRRAQCGPRVRLEHLGGTASLWSSLHQL